jgi:hypothetical protein
MSFLTLAALALAVVAATSFPTFDYYTVDFVFSLPYNGISEPVRIYYDAVNNLSRTGRHIDPMPL